MAGLFSAADMKQRVLTMNPLQLSLLVAIPFLAIFAWINFTYALYELWQLELLMLATLSTLYWWTTRQEARWWQQNLFILHPAVLFAMLFFQGGFNEVGFIWSFGFPFIACLSSNSRIGLFWTVLYAILIAGLSMVLGDMAWQQLAYLGLAYIAFSLIATYSVLWRERSEASNLNQLSRTVQELKHESHVLAENKVSHRTLLDALPTAMAVHGDGRWLYCNLAAIDLLVADSAEAIVGTSIFQYVHSDEHEQVRERIAQMEKTGLPAPVVEMRLLQVNGGERRVMVHSSPVRHEGRQAFMVTFEALEGAEKKHYRQAQLEQSQRLESLGVLAGGIAHDFNNLLAAILGNAELARRKLDDKQALSRHIDNIVDSCDHAAELCKQMLAYAGKGSYKVDVLNLNAMVKSMGKLIRASVSSHIALKIKLDDTLPGIEGDAAQIQQLLLNFIVNSAEAIGAGAGEIKVSSGVRFMQRKQLDKLYNGPAIEEGQYVIIEVRDNGCGMSKAVQERIFDPFYTTKDTGSGLGLSAVLGIVRGHHGALQLFSAPGKGTAFRVFLPSTEQGFIVDVLSTAEVDAWQGGGMVLVVDDDLRVRNVATSYVEEMHFDVVTAEDGKEGIEVFQQYHTDLAAVLLDMTMPVLGGVEAMQGMRAINAHVPIIIVSGYSEVEAGSMVGGNRPDAFIQKPFKAKELKSALYAVLHP